MAPAPNTNKPPLVGHRKKAPFFRFGSALLLVLGAFVALGLHIDRQAEREHLDLYSERQHTMVVLIRRGVEARLEVLLAQARIMADVLSAAKTPAQDSAGPAALLQATLDAIPDIPACAWQVQGEPPLLLASASTRTPRLASLTLSRWMDEAHASPEPQGVTTPVITAQKQLLGIIMRVPTPAGQGTLALAVDLGVLLARFHRVLLSDGICRLVVLDDTGTVIHGTHPGFAGHDTHAEDGTDTHSEILEAIRSEAFGTQPRKDDDLSGNIISWDTLHIGNQRITFALTADIEPLSAHQDTARMQRFLIAGLLSLSLAGIAGIFFRGREQLRLADKNLLLQTHQETSPDGILVMDATPLPQSWNARLLSMLGLPEDANGATRSQDIMLALQNTLDNGQDGFLREFNEAARTPGKRLDGQEVPLRDGRILEIHSRSFASLQGGPKGRIWFLRDITDRLRTREAFRRSREQLQSIIDNVPSLVYLRDPAGRFILVNRRYHDFFGWPPGYAEGKTLGEVLPYETAQRVMEADRTIVRTAVPLEYEETLDSIDGQHIFLTREVPIIGSDGAVAAVCGISTDITGYKRLEHRLRDSLEEFETIFDNSLVGVLLLRGGRTIARVNSRLAGIMGYEPHEMIGRTTEFLHLDRQHFEAFGREFITVLSSREVFNQQYRFRRRDGRVIWCQLSGKALDPTDTDQGILWIIDDITERKNLENLREDVERIMRHDLKSPLATVIYVQQLLEEGDLTTEEHDRLLVELKTAGHTMLDMINRSMDIFKMEQGSYVLQPETFDLMPLLRTVVRDLRAPIAAAELRVVFADPAGQLPTDAHFPIHGERLLCYSLFANLLRNAVEASPRDEAITVTLAREAELVITIHNQGSVPEEIRNTFFEKYVSAGKAQGTGLGTYSARLIAEAHGGCLSMRTSDQEGTTITIRLPAELGGNRAVC